MRFALSSPSLKIEIKYAMWIKFDSGKRNIHTSPHDLISCLSSLINWLNHSASSLQSLMERTLEEWEISFRKYLVKNGGLRNPKAKALSASQVYVEYIAEDKRILLLRQLFIIIREAYDDRPEVERDNWDMRKMGLEVNLVGGVRWLNFSYITQPWLRCLAKKYMEYNIAVNSPGDCYVKLRCIQKFSEFLIERDPEAFLLASDVNRLLIVQYIGFLREKNISDRWILSLLSTLRTFLETCTSRLGINDLSKERLIFHEDLPKISPRSSREIPEGVLAQLREHLNALSTTILRMVIILLECGLRISELCSLPLNCLTCDDEQHWSLKFYQIKLKQEYIIPLVNKTVIQTILIQQQSMREQWGTEGTYLFPSVASHFLPFKSGTFIEKLNTWAFEHNICDSRGMLYHFQTHQFRHTVGMRLINDDVPIDVVSRLLGHHSVAMTQVYANKRNEQVTEDIERAGHRRKTVNYQGEIVRGDTRANASNVQILRRGIRGQTLPIGGCGRLIIRGNCEHANKCLSCPSWLTSTEDIPGLKAFYGKAVRLKHQANEVGNSIVVQNQDKIIPLLAIRINGLEKMSIEASLSIDELLSQLQNDLLAAEAGREEACEIGLIQAAKRIECKIDELKARITKLDANA